MLKVHVVWNVSNWKIDGPRIVPCSIPLGAYTLDIEFRNKMAQKNDKNKVPLKDEQPLPTSSNRPLSEKRGNGGSKHKIHSEQKLVNPMHNSIRFQNPNLFLNPFYRPNRIPFNNITPHQPIPVQIGNRTYLKDFQQQISAETFNMNPNVVNLVESNEPEFGEPIGTTCRRWQNTKFGNQLEKQTSNKHGLVFKIMSFNVLAQYLLDLHPELYKRHSKSCLKWEIRWERIIHEIKLHDSDILCLQEVENTHLDSYYTNTLQKLGYVGLFKKRTGDRSDGCAIYYKKEVFKLIEYTTVEYRQDSIVETTLLDRDNVAIIAKLAPLSNLNATFVVATTHLLYNPRRNDVRIAQTQMMLTEIERIAFMKGKEYSPLIITGDFNSLPDSAVLNFVLNSKLRYSELSMKSLKPETNGLRNGDKIMPHELGITDQCQHIQLLPLRINNITIARNEELKLLQIYHSKRKNSTVNTNYDKNIFSTGKLSHNFCLSSVYNIKDTSGTTFQERWVTVDYIFYSGIKKDGDNKKEDKLKLISRYSLPTVNHLQKVSIPNNHLGSDHLSLIAQFKLEF